MPAVALIAYAICFLIISPTVKSVEGCSFPVFEYRRDIMENEGPDGAAVVGYDPRSCKRTLLDSSVGSHDMTDYLDIQSRSPGLTKLALAKTINVDFIRDVKRLPNGALFVPWKLFCECRWSSRTVDRAFSMIVHPVDNNPPEFIEKRTLNISEDTPVGTSLANVRDQVTDRDYPDFTRIISFSINRHPYIANDGYGTFQISNLGDITLSKSLDYEEEFRSYLLQVSATNNVSQTANGNVPVKVINVNDSPVKFVYKNCLSGCTYVFDPADSNQDPEIRAVDADNDPIEYSIHHVTPASETGIMTLNKTTGKLRQVQHPLDPHLRKLILIIKARATSPLPLARGKNSSIDEDFATVNINFETTRRSVSGSDQVLVGHLHVPVCLIMIYVISKHVI